jgi:mono/diheme cytochrome c family protein
VEQFVRRELDPVCGGAQAERASDSSQDFLQTAESQRVRKRFAKLAWKGSSTSGIHDRLLRARSVTARIPLIPGKTRGHRPRRQRGVRQIERYGACWPEAEVMAMKRITGIIAFIAIAAGVLGFGQKSSQNAALQTNRPSPMQMLEGMLAADGATVLLKKGCTSCHSFDGWGGMLGPDLGADRIRGASPSALAAAMWNQAPSMWRSIGAEDIPALDQKEAAAIFAFFYSRLYFDSYSDSPHGENIFRARCGGCHDVKPQPASKKAGPPAMTWGSIKDPMVLIGRMWNHSTDMLDQTLRQGRNWPALSGQDTRDLLAYLWRLPELRPEKSAFRFGDDANGRSVFNQRCGRCHTLGGAQQGFVDLTGPLRRVTMLQMAASMWNHAPSMKQKNPGIKLPTLNDNETRDLVTYLVVGRAFEETGDAGRGEQLFQTKQCASCHESGGKSAGAPPLSSLRGPFNPVRMTSALWSHGPTMLTAMKREKVRWPGFQTAEMLDLVTYLNEKAGK